MKKIFGYVGTFLLGTVTGIVIAKNKKTAPYVDAGIAYAQQKCQRGEAATEDEGDPNPEGKGDQDFQDPK